ncbi:MAG: integrin alpha, partial [Planctomycetota bacterium]
MHTRRISMAQFAMALRFSMVLWFALGGATAAAQDLTQYHVYTFQGSRVADALGAAVIAVGDLDGDGVEDVAIGAPRPLGETGGSVTLHSGATGAILSEIDGPAPTHGASGRFGAALALLPDLDEDGFGELAVGLPRDDAGGLDAGAIELRGLPGGELLARLEGFPGEWLGTALAVAELDGEELPELVAGGPGGDIVVAWSGQWLRAAAAGGSPPGDGLVLTSTGAGHHGTALAVLGDLDGDGRDDLAIGAPSDAGSAGPWAGSVTVLSGGSGALLTRLEGSEPSHTLGSALSSVASLDGDGLEELVVGAPGAGGERRGEVSVWS